MKVKELIKLLETIEPEDQDKDIMLASDEEWNIIYKKLDVSKNLDTGNYIIWGHSGSGIDYEEEN